jgi:hypothetical protein
MPALLGCWDILASQSLSRKIRKADSPSELPRPKGKLNLVIPPAPPAPGLCKIFLSTPGGIQDPKRPQTWTAGDSAPKKDREAKSDPKIE